MWWPDWELGWVDLGPEPVEYGEAYLAKYEAYGQTLLGRWLDVARVQLVHRHYRGPLLDVGVGAGTFMRAWRQYTGQVAMGYDVNRVTVQMLQEQGLYRDPYLGRRPAVVTLWDVLEHIDEPQRLLDRVDQMCFLATPTYRGPEQVLMSRHYRPGEHCWYFTVPGLLRLMLALGWEVAEVNSEETRLGRDSIISFAFRRA